MTYARPLKPAFYTDNVNWLKLNGKAKSDILTDRAGVYDSGDKFDLFDLNPQNTAVFDTSANLTTHIVIQIDLQDSGADVDYVAIMNHNLNTAEGAIRIAHSASTIASAGGGSIITLDTSLINAEESGGTPNVIEPTADGDTLFTFTSSSDRYWIIEIMDLTNFSATDLFMGSIMFGEAFSLPLSPDMSVNHSFSFEGVKISTGISGKRHSSPNWIKADNTTSSTGNYIPFRLDIGAQQIPGREAYSLAYSFIDDTYYFPSDLGAPSGNSFVVNVMSKTAWNAAPFIMAIDSVSTTSGDYIYCRFRENSFNTVQVASGVYSTSFSVDQEF